ncbi:MULTISPECIES: GNAT family N-acetyltransferase [unclassified Fusibacter]|uniref:GNAT family N-acetyltransferase n=1 Tax=unclassified Fusibacter TaxID=2624464 RepID=UPI0013E93EE3|nr:MULTISPECIES: GNAT family N-acetyltransferase [unclassified Fusibacter]MCK8061172.1 GNAT family N-acetyltransferase [Fusibacter sp. A2]NPE23291.1 GNAT family N-acetyltransferase [Fusibacter sp. A1]
MMMTTFKESTLEECGAMQIEYYKALTAPLDDMWELGIIAKANYFKMVGDEVFGYLVLDDQKSLLQFYVCPEFINCSSELFNEARMRLGFEKAYACTYEPWYLSICLDRATQVTVNSIMYEDALKENQLVMPDGLSEVLALSSDLDAALTYTDQKVEIAGDWLIPYYDMLVDSKGLYLYYMQDEIVGTGEIRQSKTSHQTANLGMTVSKDHRKKGLGTLILSRMKALAYERGLAPVCSTSIDNVGSQNTIMKAGFTARNRVLEIILD